ncbi:MULTISPECIES: type II secretion system minor pseudopilin GspI [Limnobacter]|uniref:Type II secretion system protein I n=1 Tax=Limnobacter litoralis TaxID=481366 RepID=A0ABQ5YL34_9BURK|nr:MULTISPECIES: type II secretion system minor pseudopilin GspI [Limnobacter]GLR25269.1 type II secretion system protein GspI [Limnobacter litoralis]HEX5486665.1 type II secretion system minor pseudopilin GspI [Limnobacter sp.]
MRPQRGFTLIEALVAMTIIAVALMACLKAAGNLNLQQDDLIKRQYAQWSADSAATYLRVSGVFPDGPKVLQTNCNQGHFRFVCSFNISTTPNPNFRRVEITVRDAFQGDKGNQLARLVVFLSSAP